MYIPTYDTLISKLESILRYIHVIHFWKWETNSDMTVKSQMINSRKIFAVCCDGKLVYVWCRLVEGKGDYQTYKVSRGCQKLVHSGEETG